MQATQITHAAVRTTDYYGPSHRHALLGCGSALEAEQLAAAETPDPPRMLGHNVSGQREWVGQILYRLDTDDWSLWPQEILDAACEACRDQGIDPEDPEAVMEAETDWLHEAAEACGYAAVAELDANVDEQIAGVPEMQEVLIVKPID